MNRVGKFQIGKNGINQGIINSINLMLKTHKTIRISVLKSSGRNREVIKEMALSLINGIDFPCSSTIIGFTIILKRQSTKRQDL